MTRFLVLMLLALAGLPALLFARGPDVPCTGIDCEQVALFDMPASGFWGNPQEVGIGIHMYVQNEVMFGMYYGYAPTGAPVWYLFTARLQRADDSPGLLRAEATLEEYRNGSCIGCAPAAPEQAGLPGHISLVFDQRNHGIYRIDGGEAIHIVPLHANSAVAGEFRDTMRYALPDPEGAWVLTFKAESGAGAWFERVGSISGVFGSREVRDAQGGHEPHAIDWTFASVSSGEVFPIGRLFCTTYGEGSPPSTIDLECGLELEYPSGMFPEFDGGVRFPLPYANIGDGRIVSKDPVSGIRLEAFRIGYD
ncbi:hypothetical protein [Dokdonella sp.]|uniref:hypothetical protein n=1 Tax=Dokdonella sp. TaxID=2291710 RepID=UPI003AF65B6B